MAPTIANTLFVASLVMAFCAPQLAAGEDCHFDQCNKPFLLEAHHMHVHLCACPPSLRRRVEQPQLFEFVCYKVGVTFLTSVFQVKLISIMTWN